MRYKTFIFKDYEVDETNSTVKLNYSYDDELNFTETLTWSRPFADSEQLKPALQLLHLVLGISYFKAYLAPNTSLPNYELTDDQANFLNELYTNGLGEFLYINKLDFSDIAKFSATSANSLQANNGSTKGILLPVSGGKDSLLSAEVLLSGQLDFTPLHITTTGDYPAVLDQFGVPPIIVKREVAKDIITANQNGALNGHVPFSAIVDSILLLTASMFEFKDIVHSHENSANEATTVYKGIEVNHQFSKTIKFNNLLQDYVLRHISSNINIFSLLSDFSELDINELFVKKGLSSKYKGLWSSCNRANYKLGHNNHTLTWCGECSKCANAFLLLAPYTSKTELLDMFSGKNLLSDPDLKNTFYSLLGESGAKPFECVAEINELRQAVKILQDSDQWPEVADFPSGQIESLTSGVVAREIPSRYKKLLKNFQHQA